MALLHVVFVALVYLVCAHAGKCLLTGVNQAGAEGGATSQTPLPGTMNINYVYPKTTVDYFIGKKMNVVRLPFRWQRVIQPTKTSNFSSGDIAALLDSVNYMSKNAYVLLDPHDYGSAWGGKIGESSTTIQDFADFWGKLAGVFKSNPRVIYGLMNEPISNNINIWRAACQAAINSIRAVGATQTILIPGIAYTGAHSWISSKSGDVMWDIQDSANNYAYEVHQYLDSNSDGQSEICDDDPNFGVNALKEFTEWLRAYNKMGFLGEFGAGNLSRCLQSLDNMMTYMDDNSDVWLGWTYWSSGPFWPIDYFTNLQPRSPGVDRPQWAVVGKHINPTVPATLVVGKTTPPGPVYIAIYKDSLMNQFGDYGWADKNNGDTSFKHSGSAAISFTNVGVGGRYLAYTCINCWNNTVYTYIQFWVYLTVGSTDRMYFALAYVDNGSLKQNFTIDGGRLNFTSMLAPGTTFALNKWLQITVPLDKFPIARYGGVYISTSGNTTGYIDDMYLVKYVYGATPGTSVSATSGQSVSTAATSGGSTTKTAGTSGTSGSGSTTKTAGTTGSTGSAPSSTTKTAGTTGSTGSSPGSTGSSPGSTGSAPGSTGSSPGSTGSSPGSTGSAPSSSPTGSSTISQQDNAASSVHSVAGLFAVVFVCLFSLL